MQRVALATVMVVAIGGAAGCASASRLEAALANAPVLPVLPQNGITERIVPGLANAPVLPENEITDVHDVVANGHDSCPRARVVAPDPLWDRYPPCPGTERKPPDVTPLAAPVLPAEPVGDELWNVHYRGLPPCEEARGSRTNELALAICWNN
jgi:hypothetical protein